MRWMDCLCYTSRPALGQLKNVGMGNKTMLDLNVLLTDRRTLWTHGMLDACRPVLLPTRMTASCISGCPGSRCVTVVTAMFYVMLMSRPLLMILVSRMFVCRVIRSMCVSMLAVVPTGMRRIWMLNVLVTVWASGDLGFEVLVTSTCISFELCVLCSRWEIAECDMLSVWETVLTALFRMQHRAVVWHTRVQWLPTSISLLRMLA